MFCYELLADKFSLDCVDFWHVDVGVFNLFSEELGSWSQSFHQWCTPTILSSSMIIGNEMFCIHLHLFFLFSCY